MNPNPKMVQPKLSRIVSVVALLLSLLSLASAQNANIRLTSYPSMTVADGRSTITISAEIRDRSGRLVQDGTQVVFTTNLGFFNDPVAKTSSGIARVIFSAGSVPGTAKIQASALTANAVATLDVEIVGDRALLSTAKEYIEVTADDSLIYSMDQRVIAGTGVNGGVKIRYRDIEIVADDAQVTVPTYEVRARKAHLKFGKVDQYFDELYIQLNQRKGYGSTTTEVPNYEVKGQSRWIRFDKKMVKKFGMVQIKSAGIEPPKDTVSPSYFEFSDILDSTSTVQAKKATAFPKGHIQFHRADLYVGETRVMRMPMYQVNMYGQTPLATEQIVNVYDNQLAVNYPHYLSLKPGETSLLRLSMGQKYGRSSSGNGGIFLDYELNWNRGDDMDGGIIVSGMNRSDWSIGARQLMRLDPRTVVTAQVDLPAHRSIYGSTSLSHQLDGFQLSLNGNSGASLRGNKFESSQANAILEKDPTSIGNLPLKLFYGVSASTSVSRTFDPKLNALRIQSQESAGFRSRLQLLPQQLDSTSTLSASIMTSKLFGRNVNDGLTTLADISVSKRFGAGKSININYNYTDDGVASALTGRHSLSAQTTFEAGWFSLTANATRSLDVDRHSVFVDTSLRVSNLWRISYSLTLDQYLNSRYVDDFAMLSYRLGIREIGVAYSFREKRLGFQLLGTTFN